MKEKKQNKPFQNVKVVVRPSPPALKVVLILLILFSILALAALRWVAIGIQNKTEEIRSEAAEAQYEKEELQEKIDSLGSVKSVEQIAEEELGLINPDTVILEPNRSAGEETAATE